MGSGVEEVKTVVVFGVDPVVGQSLKLLLGSEERSVSFFGVDRLDEGFTFEGIELVVLTPGLGAERRARILEWIDSASSSEAVPLLELVAGIRPHSVESGRFVVSWPCRAEELGRHVEVALSWKDRPPDGCSESLRSVSLQSIESF